MTTSDGSAGLGLRPDRVGRARGQRARIRAWPGDADTAHLSVRYPSLPVRESDVARWLGEIAERGYRGVITAALNRAEQAPFRSSGFRVVEELHLLSRTVPRGARWSSPAWSSPSASRSGSPMSGRSIRGSGRDLVLRRGRRRDHAPILDLDGVTFDANWRLDRAALVDALAATPTSRLCVATQAGDLVGYAVTGRAGSVGYLQRLAVHPGHQRKGVGRALLDDALRWLGRRGARRAMVNTQEHNAAALALYEAAGFARQASGLAVLGRSVDTDAAG